jgi:hypothetical protein
MNQNTVGRWIAVTFDSHFAGLASLIVLVVFVLVKAKRDRNAISPLNCIGLALGVFAFAGATNAGAVFLLTSPPAFDLLAKDSLALVGVVTVIAVYFQVIKDVIDRFKDTPKPPVAPIERLPQRFEVSQTYLGPHDPIQRGIIGGSW